MNPVTASHGDSIASIGERCLVKEIRKWLGASSPAAPAGIGDDAAVLTPTTPGHHPLITTDSLILDRHFLASDDPAAVGAKLILRNVSDIAAMGGSPTVAVIACMLPANTSVRWLEQVFRGMAKAAIDWDLQLVGGDLAQSHQDLIFNLTLMGEAEHLLLRTGGRIGDQIAVTGPLGGSFPHRHLHIEPRIAAGKLLAAHPAVHAGMDLSDGLASDLPSLLPEGSSASINVSAIPIHPDAERAALRSDRTSLHHALCDGEDHELVFLIDAGADDCHWKSLCDACRDAGIAEPVRIGAITTKSCAPLINAADGAALIDGHGFNHFH